MPRAEQEGSRQAGQAQKGRRRKVRDSINQYGVFPLKVSAVQTLTPYLTRVSLTGRSLLHAAAPIAEGTGPIYDAYIKLLIPPAGASGPTMIELDSSWRSRWLASPESQRGAMRTYTVRRSRLVPSIGLDESPLLGLLPAAEADLFPLKRPLPAGLQPEIDVDFVLHTDKQGQSGPGSAWAQQVQPGQEVSILAPLYGSSLWSSFQPAAADRNLLLLGDETAAPALLSILDCLPAQAQGSLILETPGPGKQLASLEEVRQAQARCPGLELTILPRRAGQQRGQQLAEALRLAYQLPSGQGLEGVKDPCRSDEYVWELASQLQETYVFIAGEASLVKSLRRICLQEAQIPREAISFMGYWKAGRAEG